MSVTITAENFTDYPVGTELEISYGAYYPTSEGKVIGYTVVPESSWEKEKVALVAEFLNHETNEMEEKLVYVLSDVGVGVRLISIPEKKKKKPSPWSLEV